MRASVASMIFCMLCDASGRMFGSCKILGKKGVPKSFVQAVLMIESEGGSSWGPLLFMLGLGLTTALRPVSPKPTFKVPLHRALFAKTCEVFELIKPFIRRTPLLKGDSDEGIVYFKMENLQFTGSFKLRGALSKVLTLSKEEKNGLITTASTGNHGLACIR